MCTMECYSVKKKRKQTIDTQNNLDESLGNRAEWKKTISKGYVLCESVYITFFKWKNYGNGEQKSDC